MNPISLYISQPFSIESNNYSVLSVHNNLSVNSPKKIYLLLDISLSMFGERISLLCHSCKAIIESSDENIEIAIFVFGSNTVKMTELLPMTRENKDIFLKKISEIVTNGTTNLEEGLDTVLTDIQKKSLSNNIHCIVFTDGEPNNRNVNSYKELLNKYYKDESFNCIIDIFGFGNSLNLEIIECIYTIGKGIFSYISDRNMMATILNNYISNLFSTSITNANIWYEIEDSNNNIHIEYLNINDIQSGQVKNYLIKIPENNHIGFLRIKYFNSITESYNTESFEEIELSEIPISRCYLTALQYKLIEILSTIKMNILSNIRKNLIELYEEYTGYMHLFNIDVYKIEIHHQLDDILSDDPNKGQIIKAIDNYHTWGNKYLISLLQAHINKCTINFKDESLQKYSGVVSCFNLERLNVLFNTIEFVFIQPSSNRVQSTFNPQLYNDPDSGCFDGNLQILINIDGIKSFIKLKDIKSNDIIFKDNYSEIKIQYIMKTKYEKQVLYKINDLIGTSTHPIYDKNKKSWIKMSDHNQALLLDDVDDIDYLYTVSLTETSLYKENKENISYIILNGIKCATFGHGDLDKNENDPQYSILSSTFWGKTILSIFEKFNKEKLLVDNIFTLNENYQFIRDKKTGWCIDLIKI